MNSKQILKYVFVGIGLGVLIFLIIFFGFFHKNNNKKNKPVVVKEKIVKTKEGIEYSFFYPSEDGDYLVGVKKKIIKEDDLRKQIKELILELFKGPEEGVENVYNPFSKKLKLNEFYLIDNSIVVVDLNDNIYENLLGGSSDEILTIYSIVDTISYNFPFVKATQIIINGREAETLAGHIDISRPLRFDPRWIKVTE